jgi:hypothetical protein
MIELMDVDAVREILAPLWAKNRDHILDRLSHVRHALTTDAEPTVDERTDLHALVGTLGTYGWPEGSELVERIRRYLVDRDEPTDGDTRADLIRQLDALTTTLSGA